MTPMCAAPFAPPPESTSPILGRDLTAVESCENAENEISINTTAAKYLNKFLIRFTAQQ